MYDETFLKKDPNISTHDGLVDLAAELAIQHKSLDIALNNQDASLKILLEVNKTFLAKYCITPQERFDISVKKGQNKN